jgi:hypothetical protein
MATAAAADEDEVMPSAGVSVATAQGYASTTKLFDVFRNSNEERAERFPSPFDELDEEKVREMDTYARFTYFISYTYIIPEGHRNSGEHLSGDVVLAHINRLIQLGHRRFKNSTNAATQTFFTCAQPGDATDSQRWLTGMRRNAKNKIWQRSQVLAKETDQSATPLYREAHIEPCNRAYAREDSSEAHARKFALNSFHHAI